MSPRLEPPRRAPGNVTNLSDLETHPVSRDRDDGSHDPGRLGEPATEQYVGRRDLTHWSRPVRAFVRLVLRISRNSSAWHVLLVTAAIGAGIALLLNWAAEEIYDSVTVSRALPSQPHCRHTVQPGRVIGDPACEHRPVRLPLLADDD